jgi:hypothetical protein
MRALGVAVLTAPVALVVSGFVADRVVGWYRISSFEGGAGFFVVGLALLGGIGGFLVGLVAARIVAARPRPGFLKAFGAASGVVLALAAIGGGAARVLADIPPEIDGEPLFLLVEIRWPEAQVDPPAAMPGSGLVSLGAASGRTVRRQEHGPLFVDDARREGGRWIVPGAVEIFTSRGQRVLDAAIGERRLGGFIVPLPAHPGTESRAWSPWYPAAAPGAPALPDRFTYRYRVIRQSEPMRETQVGPFAIATVASGFYRRSGSDRLAAYSTFVVRHDGRPVEGLADIGAVAAVSGPRPALLVQGDEDARGVCVLLSDDVGRLVRTAVGPCTAPLQAHPVTSDPARFAAARTLDAAPGWVDRTTFATPGLYQVGHAIVDTRDLSASTFDQPPEVPSGRPPLAVSPDERSIAWLGETETGLVIAIAEWRANRRHTLPIDRARMRYGKPEQIDPAWLEHHFAWRRDAGGVDRLAEREGFVPLPHRGTLTLGAKGQYQLYWLEPGGEPLRDAIVDAMVSALGGERLPDELDGYRRRVRLGGRVFVVTAGSSPGYVAVSMDQGGGDPDAMRLLAGRLDALVATGKFDAMFVDPGP